MVALLPRRRAACLAVLALGLLFAFSACSRKPLQVVYYYKAGAPGVEQRIADVAALEREFPGRVVARSIDAASPEAQRDLEHLDIGTSGIAVRNSSSSLVFKQGESILSMPAVRTAVRGALGIKGGS